MVACILIICTPLLEGAAKEAINKKLESAATPFARRAVLLEKRFCRVCV